MPDNSPDLDLTFLYEIADGSDEFIVESIGLFLEQSPGILQDVSDAVDAAEWAAVATSAHKIKANLGFFGMNNSHALIVEIEAVGKAGGGDVTAVKAKFGLLKALINESLVKLSEIKSEKEANL